MEETISFQVMERSLPRAVISPWNWGRMIFLAVAALVPSPGVAWGTTLQVPSLPSVFPLQPQETNPFHAIAWGANGDHQTNAPAGFTNLIQVASEADAYHAVGLRTDGTVVAWGRTNERQCDVPQGLTNVVQVTAGLDYSLALLGDGTVRGWGKDAVTNIPAGLSNVVQVEGGDAHACALRSDGTVVAWGDNTYAQTNLPANGLSNVVQIACGNNFTVALLANGTVQSWGSTFDTNNIPVPFTNPVGLTNIVQVAAGAAHAVALLKDSTVIAWGDDSSGQCDIPPGITNVLQVAAGAFHSAALLSPGGSNGGSVLAWGEDGSHQCDVPTILTNAFQIAAGSDFTVALASKFAQPAPTPIYVNLSNTPMLALTFTNQNQSSSDSYGFVSGPASFSNNILTFTGTGTVVLTQTFAGNGAYLPATNLTSSVVITLPKSQSNVSFSCPSTLPYQTNPLPVSARFSSGLDPVFSVQGTNVVKYSTTSKSLVFVGIGSATLTVTQPGNYSNGLTGDVSGKWLPSSVSKQIVVTPGLNAISPVSLGVRAGLAAGLPFVLTNSNTSAGLPLNYQLISGNGTCSNNVLTPSGSGTLVLVATQRTANPLYLVPPAVTSTITAVQAGQQTITFPSLGLIDFSTNPIPLSAVAGSGLPVVYTISDTNLGFISNNQLFLNGAGTATITASQPGNYITNLNGSLPVYWLPAQPVTNTLAVRFIGSQTITFPALGQISYGTNPVPLTASVNSGLPITFSVLDSNIASVQGSNLVLKGVGTTTVAASQSGGQVTLAGGQQFLWNPADIVTNTLVVIPGTQSIPALTLPGILPVGTAYTLPQAFSSAGLPLVYKILQGTNLATLSNGVLSPTGTGTVVIGVDQSGNGVYLPANESTYSLNLKKAQTIAPFKGVSNVVYAPNLSLAIKAPVSSSGLPVTLSVLSGPAFFNRTTLFITNAGTVTIAADQAGNTNYAPATEVLANFTVSQSRQSFKTPLILPKTVTFTTNAILLTNLPAATTGLPVVLSIAPNSLGIASLSGNAITLLGAGTATVVATIQGSSSYLPASTTASMVVLPVAQTFKTGLLLPKTNPFTTTPITIPVPQVSTGIVPVLSLSTNSTRIASLSGNLLTLLGTGTVTVVATAPRWGGYLPATTTASMTVVKGTQTISFALPATNAFQSNGVLPLNGSSSSGLPVTYVSAAPAILTISGSNALIKSRGSTTVTASQGGSANWLPAASVSQKIQIK